MRSPKEVLRSVSSKIDRVRGEENKLGEKEESERKYLEQIGGSEPSQEEVREAVSVYVDETRLAADIAENLLQIGEEVVHIKRVLDENEGKFADEISKIEESKTDTRTLTKIFLEETEELEEEGKELLQIVEVKGTSEAREKMREANNNLEKARALASKATSEKNYSKRDLLKAGAAASGVTGAVSYLLRDSGSDEPSREKAEDKVYPRDAIVLRDLGGDEPSDYPREVIASSEIFDEYLKRLESLAEKQRHDLQLPIAVAESHFPTGDSFATLLWLMENHQVSSLGLEFMLRGADSIQRFNQGEITAKKMAEIYQDNGSGYHRKIGQVEAVFEYAQQNNVKIFGLETHEKRINWVEKPLERADGMIENAQEAGDENSIFLAGAAHVDSRTAILTNILKCAHPEVADNITPEEAVENPYVYEKFDKKIGVPDEMKFEGGDVGQELFEGDFTYTLVGKIDSVSSLYSTHPHQEREIFKKNLAWLEETAIDEYEPIKRRITRAEKIFKKMDEMSSGGRYEAVSKSGYPVLVEPNP